MTSPRLLLDDPRPVLGWLHDVSELGWVSLDDVDAAQVFALAAIAALARHDGSERLILTPASASGAARFAHALGIQDVLEPGADQDSHQRDRTVRLTRVTGEGANERTAKRIIELLFPARPKPHAADLLYHVLIELLRNVVQHSEDPAGGIVAAQRMDSGPYLDSPAVQIVVVDNGVGVFEALRRKHPSIASPEEAIVRALDPHVSGTFAEGGSGTVHNAGLGLFLVAEIAKRTHGRLLLASRGASYFLDRYRSAGTQPKITNLAGLDYPGTLVAFEAPLDQVDSYEVVIEGIHEEAMKRTPQRVTHQWLRFEDPPQGVPRVLVDVAAEDTTAAYRFASDSLEPRLLRREPVALDFRNIRVCTQSFLHALLHESVRLAWAKKVPVYILNASSALRTQLEFVESYSLGG